jgi:hypothetical protein
MHAPGLLDNTSIPYHRQFDALIALFLVFGALEMT